MDVEHMENWRLSRIEEELDNLDFTGEPDFLPPYPASPYNGSLEGTLERGTIKPAYKQYQQQPPHQEEIYSKVVILPAYKKQQAEEEKSKEAAKFITEKYDSLGRLSKVKPVVANLDSPLHPKSPEAGFSDKCMTSGFGDNRLDTSNNSMEGLPLPPPPVIMPPPAYTSSAPYQGSPVHADSPVYKVSISFPSSPTHQDPPPTSRPSPTRPAPPVPVATRVAPPVPTASGTHSIPGPPIGAAPPYSQRTASPLGAGASAYGTAPFQQSHFREPANGSPTQLTSGLPSFAGNPRLSGPPVQQEMATAITEQDILQAEMFYRSHKTEVFSCQCLATLYLGTERAGSPSKTNIPTFIPSPLDTDKWMYLKQGIPLLVLDSGDSRRARRLHLILAERGTGFVLWKESLNHLTNYTCVQPTFHTMHFSNDHTRLAGFGFDDAVAAGEFYQKIRQLTSDPDDDLLNLSGKNKKKKKQKKTAKKTKLPTKADISTPCCFTHVTKLDRTDGMCVLGTEPTSPAKEATPRDSGQWAGLRRNSASRKT